MLLKEMLLQCTDAETKTVMKLVDRLLEKIKILISSAAV